MDNLIMIIDENPYKNIKFLKAYNSKF